MYVKFNDGKELTLECPNCHETAKLNIVNEES